MIKKELEKEKAIKLRKEGKTYSEILAIIPVAKSTLSLWLREVGVAKVRQQEFTEKKRLASLRGGEAKRKQRIERQTTLYSKAKLQIGNISDRELFLLGIALYWAEGSKEKEYTSGSPLKFANSDPDMIKFFLKWLLSVGVKKDRISFDIYLHENHRYRVSEVISYWCKIVRFPKSSFKTYFKKNILSTKRRNVLPDAYFGLARIYVKESSDLVRSINGWVQGIMAGVEVHKIF